MSVIDSTLSRDRILFMLAAYEHDAESCEQPDCELCSTCDDTHTWFNELESRVRGLDNWLCQGGLLPKPWGRWMWARLDQAARTHQAQAEDAPNGHRAVVHYTRASALREAIELLGLSEPDED